MSIWLLFLFASAQVQPAQVARFRSREACEMAVGDLSPIPAGFEARCVRTGFGVLAGSDGAVTGIPFVAPRPVRVKPRKHRRHR